mgnify:CR=1 FL=1
MTGERRLPSISPYALPAEGEWPDSRADWAFEPKRAALLVHDMQGYFVDAFVADAAPIAEATANIARLIAAARSRGMPVFYTAQHGNQQRCDRGLQADLWGPGMRATEAHQRIVLPLAPEDGDQVLVKHRYSAFQRGNLEHLLRARGRDQLLITGVYAHIGCLQTAGDAFQRDIQPFFAADALADFARHWHDMALSYVADCSGVVRSTRQLIESMH